jgi:hypothetical protein
MNKLRYIINIIILFSFFSGISQKNSSNDINDIFRKNKLSFYFIYNYPIIDSLKVTHVNDNLNELPLIDSIKSKMKFYPGFGLRFNYALCFAKHASFYHFLRMNFYLHRQHIEFNNTVYYWNYSEYLTTWVKNNYKYNYTYTMDMLNLCLLPEYAFRFRLNSKLGFQLGIGYNYSYTMYHNYLIYNFHLPFLVNEKNLKKKYQFNVSTIIKISKKNLLEIGLYWNNHPLWNKYLGFITGVSF